MKRIPLLVVGAIGLLLGGLGIAQAQEGGAATPTRNITEQASPRGDGSEPLNLLDRRIVPAPIESVEVVASGSTPTGHALAVVAGLRNGCAEEYDADFVRFGDFIFAYVLNTQPADPGTPCTAIYRTYEVTIDLGPDFVPGREYTVWLNGETFTFTAHGGIVPPEDRTVVPAPIESVQIRGAESFPPQYTAEIVAGLPSGCAEPNDYEVSRDGARISIDVSNTMPTGNPICTLIYRTYELSVDLGSDFEPGQTYVVDVNGVTTEFTAGSSSSR